MTHPDNWNHFSTETNSNNIHHRQNRRNDHQVRSAIDSIQDLLFDPQAASKVFPLLLKQLVKISNSDYGATFLANEEGSVPINQHNNQALHGIYHQPLQPFICIKTLTSWVKNKLLPTRSVFFNAPIPSTYQQLFLNNIDIHSVMVLPIIINNELHGISILGLSNNNIAEGYNAMLIRRITPLLGSVMCALKSSESVKGNFVSLNQKISDNRYLTTLLSLSPLGILVVSQDKTITTCNPAAQAMFATHPNNAHQVMDMTGRIIDAFIPHYDSLFQWSNQKETVEHALVEDNGQPLSTPKIWEDQMGRRQNGESFLISLTIFRYTHGNQRFTTLQIQDITAMRTSAEEYQQASQQFTALTHLVPVGIIRVDKNWNCVYANDKWYEFSGLIMQETQGQSWINAIHSDDIKPTLESLRESLQAGCDFQEEIRLVSPLGQIRWFDFNTQVLFDEAGDVQGFLGTFADITERLIHQEKLRMVAEYDNLTGLANRNLFQDRLQQAFYTSERDDSSITIFFIDLDGFKDVNDSLGHDAGDELLKHVADRLLNTLRRNDTVARFGGDEFVILLGTSETDNGVAHVANKIIETLSQPYKINGDEVFVTASLGIADGSHTNSNPEKILKQADTALYLAKREGKNNYQLFSPELNNEFQQRIALANQLRYAVNNGQYVLHYQPIANIDNTHTIGFEALLRFKDETGTIIMPDQFIPILEETGMIIEAGQWVIEETCRQMKEWKNLGMFPENGFLSFNVSPKQLLDDSIVSIIENACIKYDIEPYTLVMEITETVIISKPKQVEKNLNELKKIGIRLAMDDFGTGYSSLSYLQKYPFDHLKIDRSFVEDLVTDTNNVKITRAIISLAQSLGLRITVEGVADEKSLELLQQFGATYYQGYFLGKPEIAESIMQDLTLSSPHGKNVSFISDRRV